MSDRVALTADPRSGDFVPSLPLPEFQRNRVVAHGIYFTHLWTARSVPYEMELNGRRYRSSAEIIAGTHPQNEHASRMARLIRGRPLSFPIDYTIDAHTIPTISAVDLLEGRVSDKQVEGKRAVIGPAFRPNGGFYVPGAPDVSMDYIAILAAETISAGEPYELPRPITFVPALLIVILCGSLRNAWISVIAISGGFIGLLALPSILFPKRIYVETSSGLFLLLAVGAGFVWASFRRRMRTASARQEL